MQLATSTMFAVGQRKRRAAAAAAHPSDATTEMTSIGFNWSRRLFLISCAVAIISAACSIKTGK